VVKGEARAPLLVSALAVMAGMVQPVWRTQRFMMLTQALRYQYFIVSLQADESVCFAFYDGSNEIWFALSLFSEHDGDPQKPTHSYRAAGSWFHFIANNIDSYERKRV
jgi:hypothetical protein